jgi:hypothetical protein
MRSTNNIELNFIIEMNGTADIITDNSRTAKGIIK